MTSEQALVFICWLENQGLTVCTSKYTFETGTEYWRPDEEGLITTLKKFDGDWWPHKE